MRSIEFFVFALLSVSILNSVCASNEITLEVENRVYHHNTALSGIISYHTGAESEQTYPIPLTPISPRSNLIPGSTVINVPKGKFKKITLILFNNNNDNEKVEDNTILASGQHKFNLKSISQLKATISYSISPIKIPEIWISCISNLPPPLLPAPLPQNSS